ncbi:Dam family site-specific DNA-(adenine-N6)-methyltransferase [Campylobacter sp. VBCF_05 NA6]|uniref:DNA adenine methylase n=1 Tax=unclassified Campylobacter TaxID=2593542 RepID=UPI0022E9E3CA|nr:MULTISPECIES: Dam family site-specific DNA-(adenine-N6)-methyltransferase [unclassified Campylobacter]MDA3057640.1 Dam family site-specific DNA-(adenine-N6)-methyltransferase [Campylobacter sp. VBCF_04 NA7]MDA3058541.1 Dam family site-specific DNA-(adenine-N6)-methyltransferase [Campylobacter sp. VBCF_05 NA6]
MTKIETRTLKLCNSPLNYTGSKFRLLSQILPIFPKYNETFVDLFCGGSSVGVNSNAKNIVLNDKNRFLIGLFKYFKNNPYEKIFSEVMGVIEKFNLSQSSKFGYKFYNCDSSKGLSSYNRIGFNALREEYNKTKNVLLLYVLIIFCFNNQIRFNAKDEFNLPCGKRDFNDKMQEKLKNFVEILKIKNFTFTNFDFRNFDFKLYKEAFFYIDPPYFLASASYNENGGWGLKDELDLLDILENLDKIGAKFAFSNVIFHKNKEHKILKSWLEKHANFRLHYLDFSYKNCNYQRQKNNSQEVLITNY